MSMTERVLEVSAMMFVQHGVKSIRMDDIAAQLGISKRTIYELFKDKDTLIEQSLMLHFKLSAERHKNKIAGAENVIEEFVIMLDEWDSAMLKNYNLMQGVKKFYPKVYEKLSEVHNVQGRKQFIDKVSQGVEQGLFLDTVNIELAVSIVADSIYGVVSRSEQYLPNNISYSEAFKYIITYFLRGISTEKGVKLLDNYLKNNI